MNCHDVEQLLGVYWDLPDDDQRRILLDEHVGSCPTCSEQFEIWKESTLLIHDSAIAEYSALEPVGLSGNVMQRIYAEEAWRIPVHNRVYAWSEKMRRNFSIVVAFCMALFIISFLYLAMSGGSISNERPLASSDDLLSVAGSLGSQTDNGGSTMFKAVAVASLNDPFVLKTRVAPEFPDYYMALSIIGLIAALLVMNWLSRTRA